MNLKSRTNDQIKVTAPQERNISRESSSCKSSPCLGELKSYRRLRESANHLNPKPASEQDNNPVSPPQLRQSKPPAAQSVSLYGCAMWPNVQSSGTATGRPSSEWNDDKQFHISVKTEGAVAVACSDLLGRRIFINSLWKMEKTIYPATK